MALSLSVCPVTDGTEVCLSVYHKPLFYQNDWMYHEATNAASYFLTPKILVKLQW